MTRAALAIAVAGLCAGAALAAEPEPLDEEFLEYLAEFEDGSDNWTLFADDDKQDAAAAQGASTAKAATKSSTKDAVKREEKVDP